MNRDALGAGLLGDQSGAEQPTGDFFYILNRANELDTPGLAAPAGVDLGRDHPGAARTDLLGRLDRLLLGVDLDTLRRRHAELPEQFFGLIFMKVHADYIPLSVGAPILSRKTLIFTFRRTISVGAPSL